MKKHKKLSFFRAILLQRAREEREERNKKQDKRKKIILFKMGNSLTFEENVRQKASNIDELHTDIDLLMKRINDEANRIIKLIETRDYTDRDELCKQIGYQKVDELANFFPVVTLNNVRYRLGVVPSNAESNEFLQNNKRKICLDIVNFYLKKVNLITNIQRALPGCREMEQRIYDGLSKKLEQGGLNNEEWLNVYKKMENFNEEIKTRYELFEREIERIRQAKSVRELDGIATTVNGILSKTDAICRNYENDLILFSSNVRSPSSRKNNSSGPSKPIRKPEATKPPVNINMVISPDVTLENLGLSNTTITRLPPVPSPVVATTPQLVSATPQLVTTTINKPATVVATPQATGQKTYTRGPTQVQENVHQIPIVQRTVVEPVVVKHEVVQKDPTPAPPVQIAMPQAPTSVVTRVVTPPQVTHTHVLTPQPAPVVVTTPVVQTPVIPPMSPRRSAVKVTTTTVSRPSTTSTVIPPRFLSDRKTEVPNEFVTRRRIVTSPVVTSTARPVSVTRVADGAAVVSNDRVGVPVRAVKGYVPQFSNEIGLVANQPTLFLGQEGQGWARVRHSNGQEGYVPLSHLSQV